MASVPLVDSHAHAVEPLSRPTVTESFASLFTPGDMPTSDARHTLHYRAALALLGEQFDGETEAELLEQRGNVALEEYSADLIDETNTAVILADDGHPGTTVDAFRSYTNAEVRPVLRIEPVLERLVDSYRDIDAFEETYVETLHESLAGEFVGLKSIAGYRTGLDVGPPNRTAAQAALTDARESVSSQVEDAALLEFCLHRACEVAAEADVPVQFHTGFGDSGANPHDVNPTHLTGLLGAHPDTTMVLLHAGYPYVGEASYVVSTYRNAYLDLSIAVPTVQHGVESLLREVLEVTPVSKLLYGSGASSAPERYVLAARRMRRDLASVLGSLVGEGFLTESYAEEAARMVLRENAVDLFGLD